MENKTWYQSRNLRNFVCDRYLKKLNLKDMTFQPYFDDNNIWTVKFY